MAITHHGLRRLDSLRRSQGLDPDLPWGGRSPRLLTRAWEFFRFVRETATLDEWPTEEAIEEQCRRHHYGS